MSWLWRVSVQNWIQIIFVIFSHIPVWDEWGYSLSILFLFCEITLLHFMDDEANVLQSLKHLAAFCWGHRQIPALEADEVCVRICPVAKHTPCAMGDIFSTGGSDQLSSLWQHVVHYSVWTVIELFCVFSVSWLDC